MHKKIYVWNWGGVALCCSLPANIRQHWQLGDAYHIQALLQLACMAQARHGKASSEDWGAKQTVQVRFP